MKYLIILLIIISSGNCYNLGRDLGYGTNGIIYTNTKIGIKDSLVSQQLITKKVEACSLNILGFATFQEKQIDLEISKAQFNKVHKVYKENFWILIFGKSCMIIEGE